MMQTKFTLFQKKNNFEVKEKITIYRDSTGFEAFIVGETETAWLIDDNKGVRCKVKKSTTKNSLYKVNFDYELKQPKRY